MVNQTDVLKLHTEYLSDYLDAAVMLPLINNNKSYDLYKAQVTSDIKKFTDVLNQELGITHFTYKIYGYTIYIIENDSHNFIKIYDRQTIKEIEVYGYIPFVTHIKQIINDNLHLVGPMIQWVYTDIGDEIRIPLDTSMLPTTSMYPFLNGVTLESYYQRFLDSNANVLILIGPPGTGKTSWLKGLLNYSKSSATVTYDPNILNQDSVFANFMDDRQSSFLILEDSDTFLSSRCDGNNMMHKFLNLSNGLISNNNKKLIFSTNLPSIRDVDPALTRPGRCFDVLNFGLLTPEQATIVAQEHNIEYTGTTNCTLAEVFNSPFKHVAPSFGFNA